MQDAVVAAENRTFWTDKGIDPKGILRALFSNASGNARQGASTITQQYVKILYLTSEQSYKRKIKEAVVSLKIQQQLSKKEVLEGYLNTIYFGRGAYGIQAASKAFFDHEAKDLSLREAAVLATVLNNPTKFDPANGKEARDGPQGPLRVRPRQHGRDGPHHDRGAGQGGQAAAEVPQGRDAEPVRRPEGPHAGAGQVRAPRPGHRLRGGDRRRWPADHHDLRPAGHGRRRGGRRGAAARRGHARRGRQQGPARRCRDRRHQDRRAARLLRRPGLPRVADQLGGRRRHGRLDDEGRDRRRRHPRGLLPQRHLRGQQPHRHRGHRVREPG